MSTKNTWSCWKKQKQTLGSISHCTGPPPGTQGSALLLFHSKLGKAVCLRYVGQAALRKKQGLLALLRSTLFFTLFAVHPFLVTAVLFFVFDRSISLRQVGKKQKPPPVLMLACGLSQTQPVGLRPFPGWLPSNSHASRILSTPQPSLMRASGLCVLNGALVPAHFYC